MNIRKNNLSLAVGTAINEIVNNSGAFLPGKNTELGFFRYFYGEVVVAQAKQLLVGSDGAGQPCA
ncbi:MAG: hypothetical protein ICV83_15435 [Cytophagales bacterium]|nr:hypothetical protein [Cytophagales bacterium]